MHQVRTAELKEETPTERPLPLFSSKDDPALYTGVVIKDTGYSFKLGEQWVLGVVASSFKEGVANIYSIYEPGTLEFRGCMPVSMFKVLKGYERVEAEVVPVPTQLSLFDF